MTSYVPTNMQDTYNTQYIGTLCIWVFMKLTLEACDEIFTIEPFMLLSTIFFATIWLILRIDFTFTAIDL